MTAMVGVKAHF